MQQLQTAELKGWSKADVEAMAAVQEGDLNIHGMDQVNELNLDVDEIYYNSPAGVLYEQALMHEAGSAIVSTGALAVKSGKKTGRSPLDKRVVFEESSADDVWWGKVNIKLSLASFLTNRERAVDSLNTCKKLYVVDAYGGWDPA